MVEFPPSMNTGIYGVRAAARLRTVHLAGRIGDAWRNPAVRLGVLALASWGVYEGALVRPYRLDAWWAEPQQTIGKLTQYDPLAGLSYTLAFLVLFFSYGLACRIAKSPRASTWGVILAGAVLFNVALLSLYPVDSADVFENIMRGRITGQYGGNPFYTAPIEFQSDPFYRYVAWIYYPSAYGPLWESLAAGTARLAGDGVIANVLAFKGLGLVAYAATAGLIALTLRRTAPERALYGLTFFAWNPLVLYATAGNGHNDSVMLFPVVLGFYFATRGHWTAAALAETAGALVKFIPVLFVPLILVAGSRRLTGGRARTRFALGTLAACALLVAVSYGFYWRGGDIFGLGRRSDLFTTSLPTVAQLLLAENLGAKFANQLAAHGAFLLLAAWVVRQTRRVWRKGGAGDAISAAVSVLLFYLLVAVPWFQPWYPAWAVALAALLPDGSASRGSFLLSLAATWKMPLFDYVLQAQPGALPPAIWLEPRATVGTLGLPWLHFLGQRIRARLGKQG